MVQTIEYARVADLYDGYVRFEEDVPFFLEEATRASGEVLELMAGTGRLSIPLLEAGVRLTCIDYSTEMLQVLREKVELRNLTASIHHMDVRDLDLGKEFELVLLPFTSFAELQSVDDQRRALHRIYEHLSEDGRFICTLHNPVVRLGKVDGLMRLWDKVAQSEGMLMLWGVEHYRSDAQRVEGVQLYERYDSKGLLREKRMMETRFRIVEREEFAEMAGAAGFVVEALYGDYDRSHFDEACSRFMIWVLRKAPSAPTRWEDMTEGDRTLHLRGHHDIP